MKCIILAGGFATRLWPLTENKAKPLLHLKDRPIISHIVEGLPAELPIIVSTNAVFEDEFKAWAAAYPDRPIEIFVEDSKDDEFKKGALGATALVIDELKIDEDLLLIAGDNYFGFKMTDFISAYSGNPMLAAYDIGDMDAAKKFGVVVAENNRITEFQEKPKNPKSTLVSTGCYIFPKENLKDIVEYARQKNDDLGGIFEYLLKKTPSSDSSADPKADTSRQETSIDVFSFKEKWFDVGSFEGYLKANEVLLDNQVIEDGQIEKTGQNQLKGGIYLGESVKIENSTIENSIILKNCTISNCVIKSCIIDEGCTLKNIDLSHKMIRQGSSIEK